MRLTVVGAGGQTGRHVVRRALERGTRLPIAMLNLIFAATYADARAMEARVAASAVDWRIVRLNRLTDGPRTGRIEVTPELLTHPAALSRADAAEAILDVAERSEHARTALNVSGAR